MASCEDCIHYEVCEYRDLEKYATIQDLKNGCSHCIPTADVVPKSELSIIGVQNMALENTKMDLQRRLVIAEAAASAAIGKASDMVSEAKTEVAREIIDELIVALQGEVDAEEKLDSSAWDESDMIGHYMHQYAVEKLETLVIALSLYKKKYTEGETDGNNNE